MRPIARRTAALVAVPALALAGLVATSTPATAVPDPTPAGATAQWMRTQLTDGLVHDVQFAYDDYGLSIDFGFALQAAGHDDAVEDIVIAVAAGAHDNYYYSTYEGVTTFYPGALAKTAVFAQRVGEDATDFGGHDLIEPLESAVSVAPPTGRVVDPANGGGDANVFGQALAVEALAAEGSPSAAPALAYLLQQQCSEGWFRLDPPARDAADQTCDGDPAAKPDTDATATALAAMMTLHDDALVPAIDKAEAWLLSTQYDDGSWDGRQNSPESNANSTGLVGAVLGELGNTEEAQAAAAWVRAHQLTNVGGCTPYQAADLGAIAWNDAERTALRAGIDPTTAYVARKAAAGALGVLRFAEAAGDTNVLSSPDYVKVGGTTQVGVLGAAPGEALCVEVVSTGATKLGWADRTGEGHLTFAVPAEEGTFQAQVSSARGLIDEVELSALGKARLKVSAKSGRISAGTKQTITVKGLAPGEAVSVKVSYAKPKGVPSWSGQANAKGVFNATFTVKGSPGKARVKAAGQFKNRKGATSFSVTR